MRSRHIPTLLLLAFGAGCYDQPMATAPDLIPEPLYMMVPGPGSVLTEIWPVADVPYPVSEEGPRLGRHPSEPWDVVVYEMGDIQGRRDIAYRTFDGAGPVGGPVPVATTSLDEHWPDVSWGLTTYTSHESRPSTAGTIGLYSIGDGVTRVATISNLIGRASIGAPWMVWTQGDQATSDVVLYHIDWVGTTLPPVQLSAADATGREHDVGDRYAVWTEQREACCRGISAASLDNLATYAVTDGTGSDDRNPTTDGDWVIWEARWTDPARDRDLGAYNMETGERFYFGTTGNDAHPRIDESSVVFESDVGGSLEVMLFDLSYRWIYRVTDDPGADHHHPDVLGRTVAWVSTGGDGSGDVMLGRFDVPQPGPPSPPSVTSLVLPDAPVALGTEARVSADFEDEDLFERHTATFDWGDGVVGDAGSPSNRRFTASHEYLRAGVYTVAVTVSDGILAGTMSSAETSTPYIVVYDPAGGFATGAGWIQSPAGACHPEAWVGCQDDPTGKANFGFVSKYLRGATTPDGHALFRFRDGGIDFTASTYDWLVVNQAGSNAQFKGMGTLAGSTLEHRFMLWAGDGAEDTFRIRIWREEGGEEIVVYDNGYDQPIGGGQISVHR